MRQKVGQMLIARSHLVTWLEEPVPIHGKTNSCVHYSRQICALQWSVSLAWLVVGVAMHS